MDTIYTSSKIEEMVESDSVSQRILRTGGRKGRDLRLDTNRRRFDALQENSGYHFARDLEHEYSEVLRQEYAPQSALREIPIDRSVPEGAKYHTQKRVSHNGEWRIYNGRSDDIPTSGAEQDKERFEVLTYISGFRLDWEEQLADGFANTSIRQELELAAEESGNTFLNEKTWYGDDDHGLYGVLNYPWLPKVTSGVPMNDSGNPDDQLKELHRLANLNSEISENVFAPTRMLASTSVYNYLSTTKRSATTDTTILEAFLDNSPYIQDAGIVPEFDGAGDDGEDFLFFFRANSTRSIANCIVSGFSMLPIQERGFEIVVPVYMRHGGVIMRNPLDNLLAYVEG